MGAVDGTAFARVAIAALLVAGVFFAAAPDGDRTSAATMAAPTDPASIVIRAASPVALDAVARDAGARGYVIGARLDGIPAIEARLPAGVGVAEAARDLSRVPGVLYVEPVYPAAAADNPTDPLYRSHQAGYLGAIKAPAAWDVETGDAGVIVAVVDTGVDATHRDLQGRIWTNRAEIPENGRDDDNNGCRDDVRGCAFVALASSGCAEALDGRTHDDIGHGTFVAGVISANANGQGMVGVARGVTVMPVKVLDCAGRGTSIALAQGILYAASNGARVINVSLGGTSDPLIVREAVRVATDEKGALIVAASGNTGGPGVQYPARYPSVLAVGAASSSNPNARAVFSTSGPEIDVVAVGEGIVGTVPAGSCNDFLPCVSGPYAVADGTSFAAPQASGLAALVLSRRPGLAPGSLHAVIRDSATPIAGGSSWSGAGRIDMLAALRPGFRIGAPGTTRN